MNDSINYQSPTWMSTDRWLPVCFFLLLAGSLVASSLTEYNRRQQLAAEQTAKPCFCVEPPPSGIRAYQPLLPQTKVDSRGWGLVYTGFPYP
ncbi:hypothetical protein GCM10027341_50880 [Spirosoma knui]